MRLRLGVSFAILILAVGCKKDPPGDDAGVDSGPIVFDAGMDAGPPPVDAGPFDAGPFDAGLPTGVTMEAMETAQAVDDLQATIDGIPAGMIDGSFLELQLAMFGLDMIIGEEGIQGTQTLALEPPTIRAFADLRQVRLLDQILERVQTRLGRVLGDTAPIVVSITNLRTAVAEFRAQLVMLYQARLGVGLPGGITYPDDTPWTQHFPATAGDTSLAWIAEGWSTSGPITLSFACTSTLYSPVARVVDEATGEVLTPTGVDPMGWVSPGETITLAPGVERALSVEVRTPAPASSSYDDCFVTMAHPRRVRDRVLVPVLFAEHMSTFEQMLDAYATAHNRWAGTDATYPPVYERFVKFVADHMATVSRPEPDGVPVEDLERFLYQHYYVRQLGMWLLARARTADLDGIHMALTDLAAAGEVVVMDIRSSLP